jgi:D-alanyl-lipoteichoic acid acyltransferase DltB (MBOAT superfamily)
VSGFWHGANWTFVVWGAFHALLFLPLLLVGNNRKYIDTVAANSILPSVKELFSILITFTLVTIGWIIFRAENLQQAFDYISGMCSSSLLSIPSVNKRVLLSSAILIAVEWFGRKNRYAIEKIPDKNQMFRWSFYLILIFIILTLSGEQNAFIYFQF